MVTKSGTNALHGSAYIFNQTSVVDANSFINNARAVARPIYHQNQYGATLASWYGVSNADLPAVFPNLHRFSTPSLGFV